MREGFWKRGIIIVIGYRRHRVVDVNYIYVKKKKKKKSESWKNLVGLVCCLKRMYSSIEAFGIRA